MPFTGGAASSPERYGSGIAGKKPLVQIVYESLAAARGSAYSANWPPTTAVDYENFALAKMLTFDGYGGNARLSNNFQPTQCTDPGLLRRWEAIFGIIPLPTDTQPVRRARVAAAWARIGAGNAIQAVIDQLQLNLGALYGGVTYFNPSTALAWWPGLTGTAAKITALSSGVMTVQGLVGIPSAAAGAVLTLGNCSTSSNNGAWQVHDYVSSTSVNLSAGTLGTSPDNGVGGSGGSPTITWTLSNPASPWMSTACSIDILALLPAGYFTLVGGVQVPNSLWFQAVAAINPVLDAMLPAWMTWNVYINNSGGASGFLLDEPNIGLEVFA